MVTKVAINGLEGDFPGGQLRLFIISVVVLLAGCSGVMAGNQPSSRARSSLLDKMGVMWQTLEWSLKNPSRTGNPFDLVAKVTFKHEGGKENRVTEMFYAGKDTWKFRFTGTRTGKWTFTTSSKDPELNGHGGTVTISKNVDPKIRGFLTKVGNKFAIQADNTSDLKGYVFNVYMNGVEFDRYVETYGTDMGQVEGRTVDYLNSALDNGFEIVFVHVNNSWFKFGTRRYDEHSSEDPDPLTFRVLEKIITTAHKPGGRVHIWAWGDEQRKWTPIGAGGKNGVPDKRLQRYIAARLGPLPGWTMGYGFDLQEWANEDDLREWAEYLHEHMGWKHLLWGRGRNNSELDVKSYSGYHIRSYNQIVSDLNSGLTRPHLYEERHTYLRNSDLSMDGTRRLVWWESIAGGMGGFFGFYPSSEHPYPNPEQLRTHYTFWHAKKRFLLNMEHANKLLLNGGYVLKTPNNKHFVFYKEDAKSIEMNLSSMAGPQRVVAVDTKQKYREIDLGILKPGKKTWKAPHPSDWAIAVGNFGGFFNKEPMDAKSENALIIQLVESAESVGIRAGPEY